MSDLPPPPPGFELEPHPQAAAPTPAPTPAITVDPSFVPALKAMVAQGATEQQLQEFAAQHNQKLSGDIAGTLHAAATKQPYGVQPIVPDAPSQGDVPPPPDGFVPDDGTTPPAEQAKPDTLSGLTPDQITAKFDKLPDFLRPDLTNAVDHGVLAGADTEAAGITHAIGSMIRHPVDALQSKGATVADAYHQGRTDALAALDYVRMKHPYLTPAAEIGGAVLNPLGAEAKGWKGLAGVGAGYGLISGFEDNNGDLGDRAKSAVKHAVIGAVAAPALGAALRAPGAVWNGAKSVMEGSPSLARRIITKAIKADENTPAGVGAAMSEAQANGVPMMLADTGENARGLLAAASRSSGPARTMARDTLEERQTGLPERVINTIERDLGPVSNPHQVADTMMTKARNEAAPLYAAFEASPAVSSDAINSLLARPSVQRALKNAYRIAAEEGRDPHALGLVMGEDGRVALEPGPSLSMSEAQKANPGTFQDAQSPNEFSELSPRTVRTAAGGKMVVRGPLDITQTLRSMGGVHDYGGDLAHMGIDNKSRRLPFGGDERFLGKLVNPDGMALDDAAHSLWEQGYFPEHSDRPTVNDLLDRLHQEHIGNNRFFHPDDADEVARFEEAQASRYRMAGMDAPPAHNVGRPVTQDDLRATTPPVSEGQKAQTEKLYTPTTLDYIKRGLDDVLETYRDKTTGKLQLDTEGRAVNNTLRAYVATLDKIFPHYAPARAAWAGPVRAIDAMNQGRRALNMTADDLEARMRDMSPHEKEMFALGTRRAMAELVSSKGDSANVINAIAGTGKKRAMLSRLFGDRKQYGRFVQTLDQEKEGFRTFGRAMLGSPTALNLEDDTALKLASTAADAMINGGLPIATAIRHAIKFGIGQVGEKTRQQVTALLSETNPARLRQIAAELRTEAVRRGLTNAKLDRISGTAGRGLNTLTLQNSGQTRH